ncbi:C3HC zinc finger-like-domain-containing protein [Halenospora varia]|nr:C3HC zinc finger-like-domain-containing protein [Halenospora varia]
MNATKRKFNALLNGIGNKSTTSLSYKEVNNVSSTDITTTSDAITQAKKRRISGEDTMEGDKNSPPRKTVVRKFASTAIPHKKSASVATSTPTNESPKYAPWDRVAFLKRLKSFSNLTDWTPKPAKVNEVEWAKRGWVCQKFERVRCCLCNVEILVKLNKKEVDGKEEPVYVRENIEDALVEKYVELIVTSHDEDCLWRKRGCDDSIFKLPLNNPPATIENLQERYKELCSRAENLPYMFNMRPPPELDLDSIIGYLPQDILAVSTKSGAGGNTPTTEVNRVALMLALSGWQGHTHERLGAQQGSVSCQACFRVLGLWLFKSKQVNAAGEETHGAIVNCLDVVKEHRDYCPWRNPASQNGTKAAAKSGTSAMAGWEILMRVLKNEYYLRHGKQTSPIPKTPKQVAPDAESELGESIEDVEDTKSRDEEDKKRWARLRRVKSLFDTKGSKKLQSSKNKGAG